MEMRRQPPPARMPAAAPKENKPPAGTYIEVKPMPANMSSRSLGSWVNRPAPNVSNPMTGPNADNMGSRYMRPNTPAPNASNPMTGSNANTMGSRYMRPNAPAPNVSSPAANPNANAMGNRSMRPNAPAPNANSPMSPNPNAMGSRYMRPNSPAPNANEPTANPNTGNMRRPFPGNYLLWPW